MALMHPFSMLLGKEQRCSSSCATMLTDHPAKPLNRHVQLLMKFNEEIFKRNVLTDVECIVGGQVFKTHRAVLICYSPYLKKRLLTTEGKPTSNRIQILKIGPDEFEILLQYMYTGNLGVDCNTFLDVYKAASLLEMEDAKIECLQHKRMLAPVSTATDSHRQDLGRPIEKNNNSERWNIESAFSRLLRDPVEVIAGNTGKENETMEQRRNFRSRYDYPVPEKDEIADDLHSTMNYYLDRDSLLNVQPLNSNNVALPPADEKFRIMRSLNDSDSEFESDDKNNSKGEKDSYEESTLVLDKDASSKQDTKNHVYILVVCGMNPKNFKKEVGGEVLILDSKVNRWTPLKRTPEPRHNHCAACLYNALYVVGGCNPEETINKNRYVAKRSCFKLDLRDFKWRIMREMRYCRYDHGLVVYDGKLYAIGGQDENGRLQKSVEVYDPRRNRWRGLSSNMCCGRKAMGVATYADRIWIVGGLIESGKNGQLQAISHVDCYHPRERKWYFNLYSLPEPLCFCSLAVWQEKLYCLGGMVRTNDGKTQATNEVWFVQSGNQLWEQGPRLPQPRMGGVAVILRDNLYFLGGFDPGSDLNNQNVHFLTPDAKLWVTGLPLPSHLFGIAAVSFSAN